MKKLILSLLIFPCILYSQTEENIDSLINVFKIQKNSIDKVKTAHNLFFYYKDTDPKKTLYYLHQGLTISKLINSKKDAANFLKNIGYYYSLNRNIDSVKFYYDKSERVYTELKDNEGVFSVLYRWQKAENLEGNFDKALELSNQSIEIAKELKSGLRISDVHQLQSTIHLDKGDYKNATIQLFNALRALDTLENKNIQKRAIINIGIGRTETLRNNYKEAIPYLEKGIEMFKEVNNPRWLSISYMEIGNTYYDLEDYEKALFYYKEGLNISENEGMERVNGLFLENIGALYLEKKDYDKALEYFFESNKFYPKYGSINNHIVYLNDVGSAYYGKKDYKKALDYYTQTINLADSIKSIDNLSDGYYERSLTYEKLNKYKLSLNDYKKYKKLKDSVFNDTKSKQIEELRAVYETEKKEQQILLQENEIDLLKQKGEIDTLYKVLLGIGFLLTLIGLYALRQKLKRSKIEKEKLDLELDFKKKELTTHALHLAKKNEVLEDLKQKAKAFKTSDNSQKGFNQLIRTINFDLKDDNNWENFSKYFEQVHKDFNSNVKHKFPDVTSNELRLMALLKMNLSSKEIANILNISPEGIKKARYRLRKKLGISTEDSLQDLVLNL
ncbi:hypothetical protein DIS18_14540 [Algibacter marinivivus]|uniref:HTH luxR-type domain-containing protein n=1 Tax=Algibacter marinivivus TaxID=2100723 RepID=A0A2U2X138_9FLAO|nr:tetratricopeptide repeat protein [Algibacter marinivivus]PWH81496.1 hypothetical protein DIS18_14540 [Algibacter marinivivus]